MVGSISESDPRWVNRLTSAMIDRGFELQIDYDHDTKWQAYFYKAYLGSDSIDVKNQDTMEEAIALAAMIALARNEIDFNESEYKKFACEIQGDFIVSGPHSFDYGKIEQKVMANSIALNPFDLFDPKKDLPSPSYVNEVFYAPDGTIWHAIDPTSWAEYENHFLGGVYPTGRIVDVNNRVVSQEIPLEKSVQNSTEIPAPCREWDHDWKEYTGLTQTFNYCTKCDQKKEE